MGLIFALSSSPVPHVAPGWTDTLLKKIGHFGIYAILALLVLRAFTTWEGEKVRDLKVLWAALAVCALYAASDETHQLFVPGRHGAVADVLIDTGGALCMLLVARLVYLRRGEGALLRKKRGVAPR